MVLLICVLTFVSIVMFFYYRIVWTFNQKRNSYYKKLKALGWDEDFSGKLKPYVAHAGGVRDLQEQAQHSIEAMEGTYYRTGSDHDIARSDMAVLFNIIIYFQHRKRLALQKKIYNQEQMAILESLAGDQRSNEELRKILNAKFK